MSYKLTNKRIHYSYIDKKGGKSFGFVDVDDFFTEKIEIVNSYLRGWVLKKWRKINYTGSDINTVEFIEYE